MFHIIVYFHNLRLFYNLCHVFYIRCYVTNLVETYFAEFWQRVTR